MKNLTIFEGCDCTGKTTVARQYAQATGAMYFPFGPFKGYDHIAHAYLNGMQPAIAGHRDVVMDRCWISEPIYGKVYRGGADRIGDIGAAALADVAEAFTKVALVICDPGWETVSQTFKSRSETEMLDNLEQLLQVYKSYRTFQLYYPCLVYDYHHTPLNELISEIKAKRKRNDVS